MADEVSFKTRKDGDFWGARPDPDPLNFGPCAYGCPSEEDALVMAGGEYRRNLEAFPNGLPARSKPSPTAADIENGNREFFDVIRAVQRGETGA